ncbi:MAG: hypothetical protein GY732_20395, partial [Gammaproteobacteria bacterium]|nr:hypothetical protein [Gammaproteobacteria bacterium]
LVLGDTVYVEKVSAQEARVVAQTPGAGSMVGSGIQVVLSMGLWEPQQVQAPANNTGPDSLTDPPAPTTFPMPDIIGLTIAEAERMVLSAGQNAGATSARASIARRQAGSLPAGQIILQQDELGKQMRPYSENVRGTPGEVVFRVVISSGEDTRTFLMPNVIGLTVTEAERRVLSEARSTRATSARAVIARRQADARPAGQIIRQLEAPGTPLRPHMDDVSGTYGEVSFRVVVSSGEDRRTDNRDEIDPLDEYVADRLRNSVVVVRSSRELQAVRSLSRYFLMEEPPSGTAGNRLTYTQSTAFFVSEDGLMITTPLPPDSTSVTVQLPSGRSGVPVFSVLLSREFNLEAIAIEGFSGDVNTLELNGPDPERGTPVYLLGYALNTDWRLASGRVTGQAELSNGQRGIVTSIDHRDGFSGAPVVDQKGLLVGVAHSADASGKVIVIPVEQAANFRREVSRALRDYAD